MSGGDKHEETLALLRQISIGLGVYRLYPDEVERPDFLEAVRRVQSAAEQALRSGTVDVEIHADQLSTPAGPLPNTQLLGRLALCCYERGIERLQVRRAPKPDELILLYRTLSLPVTAIREAGGAPGFLPASESSAIVIGELGPVPSEKVDRRGEELPVEQLELWRRLHDPVALAASLLSDGGSGPGGTSPDEVLERLGRLLSTFPDELPEQMDLYSRLQEVISQLPPDLRRKVMARLLERHRDDALAQRVIGTMSNAELARALVDLSQDGLDPVELALGLDASPSSRAHLVDLTTALAQGHEEAGTIMAGLGNVGLEIDDHVWERSVSMLETVSDLLARDLQATETDDLSSIRDEFPAFEGRDPLSFPTLADYLGLEEDQDVLGQALDVWAEEIGEALRQRNATWLSTLTFPLHPDGGLTPDPARAAMYEGAVRKMLTPGLLSELTAPELQDGAAPDAPAATALLSGLGPVVVDALFDLLAEERDRAMRAQLLGLLRVLAPTSLDRVATRLSDPRWYVVRNAVHVLSHIGGPGVTDLLARAAQYPTSAVRREAIRGLASIGGDDTLPRLERIALTDSDEDVRMAAVSALGGLTRPSTISPLAAIVRTSSHRQVQALALEQIARHPAQEALETLESLASRRSKPRVGRALRREAKAAVHSRRGSER